MFQSPGGLLLILYVRSHGTQESRVGKPCAVLCCGTVRPWSLRALSVPCRFRPTRASSRVRLRQGPATFGVAWRSIYEKSTAILLCFLVAGRRIELRTSWLWIMRSNQLSYPAMILVEIEGLEPSLTEPESVVLPLHHISIWLPFLNLGLQKYECFVKMQNFFA